MTTKKPALTELQKRAARIDRLEAAIYQAYSDMDEIFALLVMAREYAKADGSTKYTIGNGINGIFSRLIDIQSSLMDNAGLEY